MALQAGRQEKAGGECACVGVRVCVYATGAAIRPGRMQSHPPPPPPLPPDMTHYADKFTVDLQFLY